MKICMKHSMKHDSGKQCIYLKFNPDNTGAKCTFYHKYLDEGINEVYRLPYCTAGRLDPYGKMLVYRSLS
jgi:hypothetical protein